MLIMVNIVSATSYYSNNETFYTTSCEAGKFCNWHPAEPSGSGNCVIVDTSTASNYQEDYPCTTSSPKVVCQNITGGFVLASAVANTFESANTVCANYGNGEWFLPIINSTASNSSVYTTGATNSVWLSQYQTETNVWKYLYPAYSFFECNSNFVALNFTFKNESNTSQVLSGTINPISITLSNTKATGAFYHTNISANTYHKFCLSPPNISTTGVGTVSYEVGTNPKRTVYLNLTLTGNSTTEKILYILDTADGIYVTFQVLDQSNSPINSVSVKAEELIDSAYYEVSGGLTDNSGSVTFWLNPENLHRITLTKTGYTTSTFTLTPTQSSYTVTMSGSSTTNETSYNTGILYKITPTDQTLNKNTKYNFGFNLSSVYWNLSSFGFTIKNSSGSVLATATNQTAIGAYINNTLNISNNSRVYMYYWWNISGTFLNGTHTWDIRNTYQGNLSIKTFFDDLKNFNQQGLDDVGRAFFYILFIMVILGLIYGSISNNIETEYAIMGILFAMVWLGEYTDSLPTLGTKYLITVITGLVMLGYIIQDNIK